MWWRWSRGAAPQSDLHKSLHSVWCLPFLTASSQSPSMFIFPSGTNFYHYFQIFLKFKQHSLFQFILLLYMSAIDLICNISYAMHFFILMPSWFKMATITLHYAFDVSGGCCVSTINKVSGSIKQQGKKTEWRQRICRCEVNVCFSLWFLGRCRSILTSPI